MGYENCKPVPSLNGHIEVSDHGRVRRVPRKMIYSDGRVGQLAGGMLKGYTSTQGYHMTSYGNKKLLTHRLIAEAFFGMPENVFAYETVNHKNGVKLDNRLANLEWASYKENNDHARDFDLNNQHGENTNLSKFSDQLVLALRRVNTVYHPTQKALAEMFGMSETNVQNILSGKSRKKNI